MKAINICLLLPLLREDFFVDRNKGLIVDSQSIQFHKDGPYPHLTLCQCILHDEEIAILDKEFEDIRKQFAPIAIYSDTFEYIETPSSGNVYAQFKTKLNNKLKQLHKTCMKLTSSSIGRKVIPEYYLNSDFITKTAMKYMLSFPTKHAYKYFNPHITVGKGTFPENVISVERKEFKTRKLAICHMGNNGTAQKVLHQYTLVGVG